MQEKSRFLALKSFWNSCVFRIRCQMLSGQSRLANANVLQFKQHHATKNKTNLEKPAITAECIVNKRRCCGSEIRIKMWRQGRQCGMWSVSDCINVSIFFLRTFDSFVSLVIKNCLSSKKIYKSAFNIYHSLNSILYLSRLFYEKNRSLLWEFNVCIHGVCGSAITV